MDSENKSTPSKKQRRNSKKTPFFFILVLCVLLIVCLLGFFYLKGEEGIGLNPSIQADATNDITTQALTTTVVMPAISSSETQKESQVLTLENKTPDLPQTKETIVNATNNSDSISVGKNDHDKAGETLPLTSPILKDSICNQSYNIVHEFLLHLDNQEYIKSYTSGIKSEVYFINLIQKLGDNPPVVSKETDDLFTILKNTAHFFRIIGKDNILALKGILANEKDQFEIVLSHFYTMTQNENCLSEKLHLNLSKDALYDYAGFFLNTMGGRLYLFRRDSVSRLTVSYYSILLIEQANRQGRNTHGLDIRPAVELLIPEIENSGTQLRLKDTYLEKLYQLEDRMN